jgi:hypothetical protein
VKKPIRKKETAAQKVAEGILKWAVQNREAGTERMMRRLGLKLPTPRNE